MKYFIIGEPCVDVIHKADSETVNSFGGILYSVISLSVLAERTDTIIPVFNIGEDEYENVSALLGRYGNIALNGIRKVDHPTRKVNLYYNLYNTDKKARLETSTEPIRKIEYDWISNFVKDEGVLLVNMISGVDIDLETFKNIRKGFPGFMHIDIHNLVMKTGDDGSRTHVHLDNWLEWCTNSDTVQMNEFEAGILSSEKKNEYQISEEILLNSRSGVKGVIITRGLGGVTGFAKKEKEYDGSAFYDLDRHDLGAVENPRFADSTGCGDVFGSAFTRDYSLGKDFVKSLHYANRIASFNASLEGISELNKLR